MPIRPEHRAAYSRKTGWPGIRQRILDRCNARCETCGVKNHAIGFRDHNHVWVELPTDNDVQEAKACGFKVVRIVLTIAHLDQDGHLGVHNEARLRALCQRCHNRLDATTRAINACRTRAAKRQVPGQATIFDTTT